MKLNINMKVNGIAVEKWMGINGICEACPYLSEECIEENDCEMVEKWIADGTVKVEGAE